MKQIRIFSDERLMTRCAYCGSLPDTRDHVPSKVLLDDPLPEHLPVVPACNSCNQSFSKDEEYLACLLEVVLMGTTTATPQMRPKIQSILELRPLIATRIGSSLSASTEGLFWVPEDDRVVHVLLKLARGHAAYELSEPRLDLPDRLQAVPMPLLSEEQRTEVECMCAGPLWPEVGSRAMVRMVQDWPDARQRWIVVQPDRYRYLTSIDHGVTVRIVLKEYLACEVHWS